MTTTIRDLRREDHDAWMPLWRAYQSFYEVAIPPAVSAVTWARLIDPVEPMGGALAWDGERATGLVHHIRHRSCWTVGDYCYLQDLFVDSRARGHGVGRALIAHVEDVARDQGCSRVHWLTKHDNAGAMALYDTLAERSGFIQYRKLFAPL